MDNSSHAIRTRVNTTPPVQKTMIWDLPLRLFHWSMVCVVVVAGVTGFLTPAWWFDVHFIAGYALAVLLTFRLVWGFIGSYYSKFGSFPLSSDGVVTHLRSILHKKSPVYTGHNPLGAVMIVVLLVGLVSLVVTGLIALGGQEKLGPLAFMTTYDIGHIAEKIHKFAAWIVVGAIAIHLLGVFVETRVFHHRVIPAMITGKKVTTETTQPFRGRAYAVLGAGLFLAITAVLIMGGAVLANKPPSGWRPVPFPAVYAQECGDCHVVYHPGLRNARAWQAIMSGLSNHYGEDASLDKETTDIIKTFLNANNAETFDTEVAHRVGRDETASFRMTDTRYWKKQHRHIDDSVFRLRTVGSKVNCNACHKDAASGRFDDAKIHIPTGDKS